MENRIGNIIGLVFLMFVLLFFVFSDYFFEKHEQNLKRKFIDKEINGVITKAYNDYENKGFFTVKIENSEDTIKLFDFYISKPRVYFKERDSVYKPKGKIEYKIYREGVLRNILTPDGAK